MYLYKRTRITHTKYTYVYVDLLEVNICEHTNLLAACWIRPDRSRIHYDAF